ncbi:UDP-N-acetylglucosamine--N-acetylmuramyl-(pentapeptide) pyrophosphoryl-undecaprenol N-acetylglucosamine transferase [Streptomyces sp. NPDC002690]
MPHQTTPFRLIVTGGGTGGHTYPALTAVKALRTRLAARDRELQVLWVGVEGGLESRVAAANEIDFACVATGKIRRSANPLRMVSAENVKDMANVPRGVAQARAIVARFAPAVVLATGGYVAVPVGLAARMCRRPLVVHEQTVRLGLANRGLARAATAFAVSSESTLDLLPTRARANAVVTGNPIRPEILSGHAQRAADLLGFDRRLPTVYVTGGAQGSVQINRAVLAILPQLLDRANVVHQCGTTSVEELRARAAAMPPSAGRYHLAEFIGSELPDILALADLVIARSGAGTIAELTALGKPTVYVPLATAAGNEQVHNAQHLAAAGAAIAMVDDVTPEALLREVETLLADEGLRAKMADQARGFGRPDAAERLVDVLLAAADDTPA